MTNGTQQILRAGAAAVVVAYLSQRWPRYGGLLLSIVVVLMVRQGIKNKVIPTPKVS